MVGRWLSDGFNIRLGDNLFPVKHRFDPEGVQTLWTRMTSECNDEVFEMPIGGLSWKPDGADTVELLDDTGESYSTLRRTEDCNVAEFVNNGEVTGRLHRGDYCLREIDYGPVPEGNLERERYVCQSYQCGTEFMEDCAP